MLAVGNPLGLSGSVTEGIVSFNGRTINADDDVVLSGTIQFSASINPGVSGGALVNLGGQVIGIPTRWARPTTTDPTPGSIGFAIASNTVKLIVPQLIADGRVTDTGRAGRGISGTTSAGDDGVTVLAVAAGAGAEAAGMIASNRITSVASHPITTLCSLLFVLDQLHVGVALSVESHARQPANDPQCPAQYCATRVGNRENKQRRGEGRSPWSALWDQCRPIAGRSSSTRSGLLER